MIEGFKLSPIQQDLWLQRTPGEPSGLTVGSVIFIDGPLEANGIKQVFEAVIARHDILTMGFRPTPSMKFPLQVPGLAAVNWVRLPISAEDPTSETLLDRLEWETRKAPDQDASIYAAWVPMHQNRSALVFQIPALMADARTLDLVAYDLGLSIKALDQKDASPFDPPNYLAVAEWLDEILESEEGREGSAFWHKQSQYLQPNFDWEKPHGKDAPFHAKPTALLEDPLSVAALQSLAQKLGTSPGIICLAVWFLLLQQHLQEDHLAVGCMADGRADQDMIHIPGPLTRYLPIHIERNPQSTFAKLVAQLSEIYEESLAWQDCYVRGDRRFASFAFAYHLYPEPCHLLDCTISVAHKKAYGGRFKLMLECQVQGETWHPRLHFDVHCFHEQDVVLLQKRFVQLFQAAGAEPERKLSAFEVPVTGEDRHVFSSLNNPRAYPQKGTVHERFEYQARHRADAVAVACNQRQITYGALNAQANQLARELRARGAGPEVCAALYADRSLEFVIGMLAIFKSGACYLPLDPNYPREMLTELYRESGAKLLVTTEALAAQNPFQGSQPFLLDDEHPWRAEQPCGNLPALPHPQQSAYMIFTSGSTGKPKGVVISQQNILHQALTVRDHHELTSQDRFLQFSSFNFDASLEQLLPPLICGATVVLRDHESWSTLDFDHKVRALALTIVNLPTAFWQALAKEWSRQTNLAPMPSLRLVIAGGEFMVTEYLQNWQSSAAGHIPLINAYGPTETTITATMYKVPLTYAETLPFARVPIGNPLFNRTCHVLNAHMKPCPFGQTGMLFLGGAGIARGYHQRPGLTAAAFLPDPFATEPGSRMYHTGDRARILASGAIQFFGRQDTQIKIRGYRIELGHIEQVLSTFPGIDQVAVHPLQKDNRDETRLAAFYQSKDAMPIAALELRDFLKERLPGYMIPSLFSKLDQLPLKPNGKIDRQALPEPGEASMETGSGREGKPRNQVEEILLGIWSDLLDFPKFGIHDSFFDLGGHSLLATRMVFKVRKLFRVNLSLQTIFNNPTIAGLSNHISKLTRTSRHEDFPVFLPAPSAGHYPLSFGQRRIWFVYTTGKNPAFHVPLPIRIFGKLNFQALENAFASMIERHQIFRTVYQTLDGQPVQKVQPSTEWHLPQLDLRDVPVPDQKQRVSELLRANYRNPFDLEQGPVIRTKLVHLSERECLLLTCIHHIASDGWSLGVLVRELTANYEAFAENQDSPLAPLPLQFTDYAVWQRQWLAGAALEKEIDYWRERLAGAPATLPLPYDHQLAQDDDHSGALERFQLNVARQAQLLKFCRAKGLTLFMLLDAAFKLVLHHLTEAIDILIGTDVANRNHEETEPMVGFFINQLVLRTRIQPNATLEAFLEGIVANTLEDYTHQDLPFDKLVEALNPPRGPSQPPFFNTKLVLQNLPQEKLQVHSLVLVPEPSPSNETKLDLQFNFQETDDGLHGVLHFKTQLFEPKTIRRLLRLFDETLAQLVDHDHLTIAQLRTHLADFEAREREKSNQAQRQTARDMFAKLTT